MKTYNNRLIKKKLHPIETADNRPRPQASAKKTHVLRSVWAALELGNFCAGQFQIDAQLTKGTLSQTPFFPQQSQQNIFGADLGMPGFFSLFDGAGDDLLEMRSAWKTAKNPCLLHRTLEQYVDTIPDRRRTNGTILQNLGADAESVLNQGQQHMFSTYELLLILLGHLFSQLQHILGSFGQTLIHSLGRTPHPIGTGIFGHRTSNLFHQLLDLERLI